MLLTREIKTMEKDFASFVTATVVTITGLTATPLAAYEAGDWLIRGRVIAITPNDSSSAVKALGAPIAGSSVGVDSDLVPEIDFTYMMSRNWGVELILASSEHDVKAKGALAGLGQIIDARTLPPTLTLQYHFMPDSKYQPYAGIGINYTLFFDEGASSSLKALGGGKASVDLDASVGVAFQVGMDVALDKDWFVNFDVKYIDMETDASVSTATLGKIKVDVDIDPWIYGIGIGKRF